MNKQLATLLLFCCVILSRSNAQTLYVDPVNGSNSAIGTAKNPLSSLSKAVKIASQFSGREPITIKLAPGLYTLTDQLVIKPLSKGNDTMKYTLEAAILPDDKDWQPSKMPVIQSISANNKNWANFDHCTGIQVERNNTRFSGLKFVGNANPAVIYYYAIERHFPELENMEVSQCVFIGDRNAAPIQGALFAQGKGIKVDHCIFYACKNALLLFLSLDGFSLTHSIIYGAYEGAIWFGKFSEFNFSNNIIANNNCFWVGMKDYPSHYTFSNSLITANKLFMGLNNNGLIEPDEKNKPTMKNVQQTGSVLLNLNTTDTIPNNILHPSANSAGRNIPAGLFHNWP